MSTHKKSNLVWKNLWSWKRKSYNKNPKIEKKTKNKPLQAELIKILIINYGDFCLRRIFFVCPVGCIGQFLLVYPVDCMGGGFLLVYLNGCIEQSIFCTHLVVWNKVSIMERNSWETIKLKYLQIMYWYAYFVLRKLWLISGSCDYNAVFSGLLCLSRMLPTYNHQVFLN